MVKSLNGDRGSSVIPLSGDEYMFLGRGRHVWLDNNSVYFSGMSGQTLADGIKASGTSKKNQMKNVAATMKQIEMVEINAVDYLMIIGGHAI